MRLKLLTKYIISRWPYRIRDIIYYVYTCRVQNHPLIRTTTTQHPVCTSKLSETTVLYVPADRHPTDEISIGRTTTRPRLPTAKLPQTTVLDVSAKAQNLVKQKETNRGIKIIGWTTGRETQTCHLPTPSADAIYRLIWARVQRAHHLALS